MYYAVNLTFILDLNFKSYLNYTLLTKNSYNDNDMKFERYKNLEMQFLACDINVLH